MAKPELRTNQIIEEILLLDNKMDAFSFKRYLKDIEAIAQHNALDAYHLKGVLYSIYQPNSDAESLANFRKALNLAPSDAILLSNYGLALSRYGHNQESVEVGLKALRRLIETEPSNSLLIPAQIERMLLKMLSMIELTQAKNLMNTYADIINTGKLQQQDFVQFLQKNTEQAAYEMQIQEAICKGLLSGINIKNARYSLFPEGDCLVTLDVDASPDQIVALTEEKIEHMMEKDFFPELVSLSFVSAHD